MPNALHPDLMTPAERLAEILAANRLRLRRYRREASPGRGAPSIPKYPARRPPGDAQPDSGAIPILGPATAAAPQPRRRTRHPSAPADTLRRRDGTQRPR